ncbi:hypothetical protein TEPIDINF_002066 [Tepidibacillus infernus]|uniref:Uncharacterized protein n=1 Tax=Tepidibacillus decaturensis TaxID=1413211 RepID=A0A135L6F4_9BACI|nr:hypothetical protein [Tepidibacillus decaturensis]KXG44509.1 hypothetical protein U473_11145 [Tepidibacillus decaturensis]
MVNQEIGLNYQMLKVMLEKRFFHSDVKKQLDQEQISLAISILVTFLFIHTLKVSDLLFDDLAQFFDEWDDLKDFEGVTLHLLKSLEKDYFLD